MSIFLCQMEAFVFSILQNTIFATDREKMFLSTLPHNMWNFQCSPLRL